jgi:hypothetical protein
LALIAWLVLVWFDRSLSWQNEERIARTGGVFTTLCIWCAYFGLMTAMPLRHPWAKVVKWGAIAATSVIASLFLVGCIAPDWFEDYVIDTISEDVFFRLAGTVAILAVCGTVLSPILWKVQVLRQVSSAESIATNLRVRVVCPRCGADQALPTGPAKCASCGLKIAIKVEEPRCVCGYLLYQLEGEMCPECGREIPPGDRWLIGPKEASATVANSPDE